MSTAKSDADEIINKSTEALSKVIFAEHGHNAKALATHKKHAKQLSLQQRDFDVVIKDMKRTSKRIAMLDTLDTLYLTGNTDSHVKHCLPQ